MTGNNTNIFDLNLEKEVYCRWHENTPRIHHAVIEGGGIAEENLEHDKVIEELEGFCKKLKLSIVNKLDHRFTPYGKSIVFILEESHIAVHTWPERGYIHIDVVTCSKRRQNAKKLAVEFGKIFRPTHTRLIRLKY